MQTGHSGNQRNHLERRETSGTESHADASSVKTSKDSPAISSPLENAGDSPRQQLGHQRFVLADPVAFRYAAPQIRAGPFVATILTVVEQISGRRSVYHGPREEASATGL